MVAQDRRKPVLCGPLVVLSIISAWGVAALTEHKVHNIVLYPDKHSWCKTTGIKQIVTYPGCSSIEVDNNVCVGGCFSYSIPRTMPSAPGEVITPYCDSCQPVDFDWKEVTLLCSDESDEEEGKVEMTKKVQVITNCTCTSCEKQYEESKNSDSQRHVGSKRSDDVPELMSLMMETHHIRRQGKEHIQDHDFSEEDHPLNQHETSNMRENLVEEEEEEEEEGEKRAKGKLDKESRTLEILHVNEPRNGTRKVEDFIEIAKPEHNHYEVGPHHSTIIKPDSVKIREAAAQHHKKRDDGEGTPSLLQNQFKIHDNEEFIDQIAVESIRKEMKEPKVLTLPDIIYNSTFGGADAGRERWADGVRMLEVPHHHLRPAVEGAELSYFAKSESKEKLDD